MEIAIASLILSIAENFIGEIVISQKDGFVKKWRYRRFIKSLGKRIMDFCKKNECVYINSSAFEYFVKHSRFVEKIIERAISVKLESSTKEFQKQMIKEARDVASAEGVLFSHSEERIVKDLYRVITDVVSNYYNNLMSEEQRRTTAIMLAEIKDFRSDVISAADAGNASLMDIQNTLKSLKKLGDSKAEPIIEILAKLLWDGRFEEIEKWTPIIQGKSDDLEYAVKTFKYVLMDGGKQEIYSNLSAIESTSIRDIVIRNIMPILLVKNENISVYKDLTSARTLSEIITFIVDGDYSVLFGEKVENESGVEVHSFELNKKYMCEEDWLVRQLLIWHLYKMPVYNIPKAMEELCEKHGNWLNNLLIADKNIDELGSYNHDGHNSVQINKIIKEIKEREEIYQKVCKEIKEIYYVLLFKADDCTEWIECFSGNVPDEILTWDSISMYVIQKRIKEKNITFDEVYQYCKKKKKYWLLVNYFIVQQDLNKLIAFCRENENVLILEVRLFFMFVSALREQGEVASIEGYLVEYKEHFGFYFEYWVEYFRLNDSKVLIDEFVSICNEGKISSLLVDSDYRLIEKLIELKEYSIAKKYIHRLELQNRSEFLTKKYSAAIMAATDEEVEALAVFRESFELNSKDAYVLDMIFSLSLSNNRTVEKKYIDAAIEIGTSRMYLLVAAVYISRGELLEAKKANRKAMLLSTQGINQAYGQFMDLETRMKDKSERKLSNVELDTAVYLLNEENEKLHICVHGEKTLPSSPYSWNNDVHVYIEDAAEIGLLRKKKGDKVFFEGKQYDIVDIIPLDTYFLGICIEKLESGGVVHTLRIPESDDKPDFSALTAWLKDNTRDERYDYNWRENYNSLEEIPLPLFIYRRFTRATYLMFVHAMFDDSSIFIREAQGKVSEGDRYILSFASLILCFELGIPVDVLKNNKVYITESTLLQIKTDAMKIINEYDRDNVSSIGVIDGNLFLNVVDEEYKDKVVKMAGKILKYVEQLEYRKNNHDLKWGIFDQIDAKEILGICDYDAISLAQNTDDMVLIATEFFHTSLSASDLADYQTISVIDWLIHVGIGAVELINYARKMVELGCLHTISLNFVIALSNRLATLEKDEALAVYEMWDDMFNVYEELSETIKSIAVQELSRTFALIYNNDINVDEVLIRIATINLLKINRLKIEVRIDEYGTIETVLRRAKDEEVTVLDIY